MRQGKLRRDRRGRSYATHPPNAAYQPFCPVLRSVRIEGFCSSPAANTTEPGLRQGMRRWAGELCHRAAFAFRRRDSAGISPGLMRVLRVDGPDGLIQQVRTAEDSDPAGVRWPRNKVHDDATAVLVVNGLHQVDRRRGERADSSAPHLSPASVTCETITRQAPPDAR